MHNRIKLHAFFFGKNNERKGKSMIVLTDFDGDTWDMKTGDVFILDFIQSDSDEC